MLIRAAALCLTLLALFAPPAARADEVAPGVIAEPPSMIVFFDYDSASLNAYALTVVDDAVRYAKARGYRHFRITGHNDTMGSEAYSMAISLRRAEAVRDEMIRLGFDASGIVVEGKGAHDPLVPTGPGVREPQNRRAVFELNP